MASKTKTTHEYGSIPITFNPDNSSYHAALLKATGSIQAAKRAIKVSRYVTTGNYQDMQQLEAHKGASTIQS